MTLLLISGGLFCAVGLWDDRVGLRPRTKLLCQVLACLPFVLWSRSVDSIHVFDKQIELGLLGSLFTVFWLVACSNVINLVDGLDGLAGTIGVISCVAVAVLSNMQGFNGPLALGLVAAGSLCGFLLHNWPPASIYLGDSGSLMIGFVIGALAIESSIKKATGFALAIPLVLVSVPVFDTCMAIVRRKLNGRGISEADRGHIHHCLQDRGLSRAQSLLVISALCVVMAGVTLVSAYFQNDWLAFGLCLGLLALLIVGRVFGYDETILFFRYIQAMSNLLAATSGILRTQLAVDRMARTQGHGPRPPLERAGRTRRGDGRARAANSSAATRREASCATSTGPIRRRHKPRAPPGSFNTRSRAATACRRAWFRTAVSTGSHAGSGWSTCSGCSTRFAGLGLRPFHRARPTKRGRRLSPFREASDRPGSGSASDAVSPADSVAESHAA